MAGPVRVPMTREGYEKIKKELDNLKSVERPKIVYEIEVARAHGDLKENAEYHAAKEKSGHIQGRIQDLEYRVSAAEIMDPTKFIGQTKVMFGARVTILEIETEKKITYHIVGEDESDIPNGKISISSPLARGLVGKNQDDVVTIKMPKGPVEYEIIKVEYK